MARVSALFVCTAVVLVFTTIGVRGQTPTKIPETQRYSLRVSSYTHWLGPTGTSTTGSTNAAGTSARFDDPRMCLLSSNNTFYLLDRANQRIRAIDNIDHSSTPYNWAGSGANTASLGTGTGASFQSLRGMLMLNDDATMVINEGSDDDQPCIRHIYLPTVEVTNHVGSCSSPGMVDGTGSAARFRFIVHIAHDKATDDVYATDDNVNNRIRKITLAGVVSTFLGDGTNGVTGTRVYNPNCIVIKQDTRYVVWEDKARYIRWANIEGTTATTPIVGKSTEQTSTADGFGTSVQLTGGFAMVMHTDQRHVFYMESLDILRIVDLDRTFVWRELDRVGINAWQSGTADTARVNNLRSACMRDAGRLYVVGLNAVGYVDFATTTLTLTTSVTPSVIFKTNTQTLSTVTTTVSPPPTATATFTATLPPTASAPVTLTLSVPPTATKYDPYARYTARLGPVHHIVGSSTADFSLADGTSARLNYPAACAIDGNKTLYMPMYEGHRFRSMALDGTFHRLLGGITPPTTGTANGDASTMRFNGPASVIVLPDDVTLVISEWFNRCLRKYDIPTGVIRDFVGSCGSASGTTYDVTGTSVRHGYVFEVFLDPITRSDLFFTDAENDRLLKSTAEGYVTLHAGSTGGYVNGATPTTSKFDNPAAIIRQVSSGDIFLFDRNNYRLRRIEGGTGAVTTFAGSGVNDNNDGVGTSAQIGDKARRGATHPNDYLHYFGHLNKVRAIRLDTAVVYTVINSAETAGWTSNADARLARVTIAWGVCFTPDYSRLYVVGEHAVSYAEMETLTATFTRSVTPSVVFRTNTPTLSTRTTSVTVSASWSLPPTATAVPQPIRYSTRLGAVHYIVGSTADGYDLSSGLSARLRTPTGCAVDANNTFYTVELGGNRLRSMGLDGGTQTNLGGDTSASAGTSGTANGDASTMRFDGPSDATLLPDGVTLVIAEWFNRCLRKYDIPTGVIRDFVATCGSSSGTTYDVTGTSAQIGYVHQVIVDPIAQSDLFFSDNENHRLLKTTSTGYVTLVAGSSQGYTDHATASSAKFNEPGAIARQVSSGDLFVFDRENFRLRKVAGGTGAVSTVAGSGVNNNDVDGVGTSAQLGNGIKRCVRHRDDNTIFFPHNDKVRAVRIDLALVYTIINAAETVGWTSNANPLLANVKNTRAVCLTPDYSRLYITGEHAISYAELQTATATYTKTVSRSGQTPSATVSGTVSAATVTVSRATASATGPTPTVTYSARTGTGSATITVTAGTASPSRLTPSQTRTVSVTVTPPPTPSPSLSGSAATVTSTVSGASASASTSVSATPPPTPSTTLTATRTEATSTFSPPPTASITTTATRTADTATATQPPTMTYTGSPTPSPGTLTPSASAPTSTPSVSASPSHGSASRTVPTPATTLSANRSVTATLPPADALDGLADPTGRTQLRFRRVAFARVDVAAPLPAAPPVPNATLLAASVGTLAPGAFAIDAALRVVVRRVEAVGPTALYARIVVASTMERALTAFDVALHSAVAAGVSPSVTAPGADATVVVVPDASFTATVPEARRLALTAYGDEFVAVPAPPITADDVEGPEVVCSGDPQRFALNGVAKSDASTAPVLVSWSTSGVASFAQATGASAVVSLPTQATYSITALAVLENETAVVSKTVRRLLPVSERVNATVTQFNATSRRATVVARGVPSAASAAWSVLRGTAVLTRLDATSLAVEGAGNVTLLLTVQDPECAQSAFVTLALPFDELPPCNAATTCGGHGTCDAATNACDCFASPLFGFYDGLDCSRCAAGFSGASCTQYACASGTASCAHGTCSADGTTCRCHSNSSHGFWQGTRCDECATSSAVGHFAGATCLACAPNYFPTGTCNVFCADSSCNGHGVCGAQGTCECYASAGLGFWIGETCDQCASGFAGANCTQTCDATRDCSGHGECQLLTASNAYTCRCAASAALGFWTTNATSTRACDACAANYSGSDCTEFFSSDPDVIAARVAVCATSCVNGACDAVGTCRCFANSTHGHWGGEWCDGCAASSALGFWDPAQQCRECAIGYFGADCTGVCPGRCATNGLCKADGTCECRRSTVFGNWAGQSCDVCALNAFGPNCTISCSAATCTGGSCTSEGQCVCHGNSTHGFWAGSSCNLCAKGYDRASNCTACARNHYGPSCTLCTRSETCGGHGSCSDTGGCVCDSDATLGFWSGATCDRCADGYLPGCVVRWPTLPASCDGRTDPVWTTARWRDGFVGLTLTLSLPMDLGAQAAAYGVATLAPPTCADLFDATQLAAFGGDGAACSWANGTTLEVSFASGFTFGTAAVGGLLPSVTLVTGAVFAESSIAGCAVPVRNATLSVPLPTALEPVTVSASTASALGPCDGVSIDASATTTPSPLMSLSLAILDVDAPAQLRTAVAAAVFDPSTKVATIPNWAVPEGTHTFRLTATDGVTGLAGTQLVSVTKTTVSHPRVVVEGASDLTFDGSGGTAVTASAFFSDCYNSSNAPALAFAWTVTDVAGSNVTASLSATTVLSRAELVIPGGALDPANAPFAATVTAVDAGSGGRGRATVTLRPSFAAYDARLRAPSGATAATDAVTLSWRCRDPHGAAVAASLACVGCAASVNAELLAAATAAAASGNVTLAASSWAPSAAALPAAVTWSLNCGPATSVSAAHRNRTATVRTVAATAVASSTLPAVVLDAPVLQVSAGARWSAVLRLGAAALPPTARVAWSCAAPCSLDLADATTAPLGAANTTTFVVAEDRLETGTYTFVVTVMDIATNETKSARTTVTAFAPPSAGRAITSTRGVGPNAFVTVTATGYVAGAPSLAPLVYSLAHIDDLGQETILAPPTPNPTMTARVPGLAELATDMLVVFVEDRLGGRTEVTVPIVRVRGAAPPANQLVADAAAAAKRGSATGTLAAVAAVGASGASVGASGTAALVAQIGAVPRGGGALAAAAVASLASTASADTAGDAGAATAAVGAMASVLDSALGDASRQGTRSATTVTAALGAAGSLTTTLAASAAASGASAAPVRRLLQSADAAVVETAERTMGLLGRAGSALMSQAADGEATEVSVGGTSLACKRNDATATSGGGVQSSGSGAGIAVGSGAALPSDGAESTDVCVGSSTGNAYAGADPNSTVGSPLISIEARSSSGSQLAVSNTPMRITLPVTGGADGDGALNATSDVECSYFNTTTKAFDTTGCVEVSRTPGGLVCECDHLTDFAIRVNPPAVGNFEDIKLAGIIYVCVITFLAIVLLPPAYVLDQKRQREYVDAQFDHADAVESALRAQAQDKASDGGHEKKSSPVSTAAYDAEAAEQGQTWLGAYAASLKENHPWVAPFFAHPSSNFTVPQRVMVLFIVIITQLFANGFVFNPASSSAQQIVVATIIATAISVPITVIGTNLVAFWFVNGARSKFDARYTHMQQRRDERNNADAEETAAVYRKTSTFAAADSADPHAALAMDPELTPAAVTLDVQRSKEFALDDGASDGSPFGGSHDAVTTPVAHSDTAVPHDEGAGDNVATPAAATTPVVATSPSGRDEGESSLPPGAPYDATTPAVAATPAAATPAAATPTAARSESNSPREEEEEAAAPTPVEAATPAAVTPAARNEGATPRAGEAETDAATQSEVSPAVAETPTEATTPGALTATLRDAAIVAPEAAVEPVDADGSFPHAAVPMDSALTPRAPSGDYAQSDAENAVLVAEIDNSPFGGSAEVAQAPCAAASGANSSGDTEEEDEDEEDAATTTAPTASPPASPHANKLQRNPWRGRPEDAARRVPLVTPGISGASADAGASSTFPTVRELSAVAESFAQSGRHLAAITLHALAVANAVVGSLVEHGDSAPRDDRTIVRATRSALGIGADSRRGGVAATSGRPDRRSRPCVLLNVVFEAYIGDADAGGEPRFPLPPPGRRAVADAIYGDEMHACVWRLAIECVKERQLRLAEALFAMHFILETPDLYLVLFDAPPPSTVEDVLSAACAATATVGHQGADPRLAAAEPFNVGRMWSGIYAQRLLFLDNRESYAEALARSSPAAPEVIAMLLGLTDLDQPAVIGAGGVPYQLALERDDRVPALAGVAGLCADGHASGGAFNSLVVQAHILRLSPKPFVPQLWRSKRSQRVALARAAPFDELAAVQTAASKQQPAPKSHRAASVAEFHEEAVGGTQPHMVPLSTVAAALASIPALRSRSERRHRLSFFSYSATPHAADLGATAWLLSKLNPQYHDQLFLRDTTHGNWYATIECGRLMAMLHGVRSGAFPSFRSFARAYAQETRDLSELTVSDARYDSALPSWRHASGSGRRDRSKEVVGNNVLDQSRNYADAELHRAVTQAAMDGRLRVADAVRAALTSTELRIVAPAATSAFPLTLLARFQAPATAGSGTPTTPHIGVTAAARAARIGDRIELMPGVYKPVALRHVSGTLSRPLTICPFGYDAAIARIQRRSQRRRSSVRRVSVTDATETPVAVTERCLTPDERAAFARCVIASPVAATEQQHGGGTPVVSLDGCAHVRLRGLDIRRGAVGVAAAGCTDVRLEHCAVACELPARSDGEPVVPEEVNDISATASKFKQLIQAGGLPAGVTVVGYVMFVGLYVFFALFTLFLTAGLSDSDANKYLIETAATTVLVAVLVQPVTAAAAATFSFANSVVFQALSKLITSVPA